MGKAKAIRSVTQRQTRLVFAMDATASREASWQTARKLHRELFEAAADTTGLAIQLCYYRGFSTFQASPWLTSGAELLTHMDKVHCEGGPTQIGRLLHHYLQAGSPMTPVRGLVFVGDAVEEAPAGLINLAGQCRIKNQPIFAFQEGRDGTTTDVFKALATASGGAYAAFDENSAERLKKLLGAVARYVSGGRLALTRSGTESDKLLLDQLPH